MTHNFDYVSEFCMECGIARFKALETRSTECLDGDTKTYLLARHRLDAMIEPVLIKLGVKLPDSSH